MEEKFIGYVEGYLTTTDIDLQNDRLTPEAVEDCAKQLKRKPSLRTLYLNHDTTQPIAYIVDFHVDYLSFLKPTRNISSHNLDKRPSMSSFSFPFS